MFDLEPAIANWRQQMLAAGIRTPELLDELELHLREAIAHRHAEGVSEADAFAAAVAQIGPAATLKTEFRKIEAAAWNRPLALAAWSLFAVSFFLPACGTGRGWQCAGLAAGAFWEFEWNWLSIFMFFLTLANLFMLASPFLFWRFSHQAGVVKWLRWPAAAAVALTWSFLALFGHDAGFGEDGLKYGCLVWAASFLLLGLALFDRRPRKTSLPQYV
jgi:hypothetical protein